MPAVRGQNAGDCLGCPFSLTKEKILLRAGLILRRSRGVCHLPFGINIAGVVDVTAVVEYAKTRPYVSTSPRTSSTVPRHPGEHHKPSKEHNSIACRWRPAPLDSRGSLSGDGEKCRGQQLFFECHIGTRLVGPLRNPGDARKGGRTSSDGHLRKSPRLEPSPSQDSTSTGSDGDWRGPFGHTAALNLAQQGYPTYLVREDGSFGGKPSSSTHLGRERTSGQTSALIQALKRTSESPRSSIRNQEGEGFVGKLHNRR